MANFFEKLKKGMGIEIPVEEKKEEEKKEKNRVGKKEILIKEEKKENEEKWPEPEGELAVDMYQTDDEIIILSAIAGVKLEDLNLFLEGDILFIEGERKKPSEEGEPLLQECYWGKFSRKIVLPTEINPERISASFKDGILTIRVQKLSKERRKKILIRS
jgi:HSP20 family protein